MIASIGPNMSHVTNREIYRCTQRVWIGLLSGAMHDLVVNASDHLPVTRFRWMFY